MADFENTNEHVNENGYSYTVSYRSADETNGASGNKKQKKGWSGKKIAALALCCSLIGGAAGAGGVLASGILSGSTASASGNTSTLTFGTHTSSLSTVELNNQDTSSEKTAAQIYAENVEATVGISTSVTTNYFGYQTTSAVSGSGFILSADGYILTNYHVVEDGSDIKVETYDGTSYDATLVGYDDSEDIAVLKIDAENLPTVVIGDSDQLNVGDTVYAIGNPLGELTFTMTGGIVSALNRSVTLSDNLTESLIQTDCAINSGNSGGALFNSYGEVIGITQAKLSNSSSSEASIENIGFAIPISDVIDDVQSIIEDGVVVKPYIGIMVSSVGTSSQAYGVPAGASVSSIVEGSPAEEAGLQANDVITKANDTEITCYEDLSAFIGKCSAGDTVTLTVYRQGETLEIEVTLGSTTQSANGETSDTESTDTQNSASGSDSQSQQNSQYGYGYDPNGSGNGQTNSDPFGSGNGQNGFGGNGQNGFGGNGQMTSPFGNGNGGFGFGMN